MSDEPPRYLVFSHEHGRWWRPGASGYTAKLSEAGRHTRETALRICASAIPGAAHTPKHIRVGVLQGYVHVGAELAPAAHTLKEGVSHMLRL